MSRTLLSALTASAIAAAAIAFSPVALGGESALSYGDLDLSTEAGKAELSKRIEVTARKACRTQPNTGTRIESKDGLDTCMADVRRQVEKQLAANASRSTLGR